MKLHSLPFYLISSPEWYFQPVFFLLVCLAPWLLLVIKTIFVPMKMELCSFVFRQTAQVLSLRASYIWWDETVSASQSNCTCHKNTDLCFFYYYFHLGDFMFRNISHSHIMELLLVTFGIGQQLLCNQFFLKGQFGLCLEVFISSSQEAIHVTTSNQSHLKRNTGLIVDQWLRPRTVQSGCWMMSVFVF